MVFNLCERTERVALIRVHLSRVLFHSAWKVRWIYLRVKSFLIKVKVVICPNADYRLCFNIWPAQNIPLFPCKHVLRTMLELIRSDQILYFLIDLRFQAKNSLNKGLFMVGYVWDIHNCDESNCVCSFM